MTKGKKFLGHMAQVQIYDCIGVKEKSLLKNIILSYVCTQPSFVSKAFKVLGRLGSLHGTHTYPVFVCSMLVLKLQHELHLLGLYQNVNN